MKHKLLQLRQGLIVILCLFLLQFKGFAQTTITVGNVTGQNAAASQPCPYGAYFSQSRMQYTITPTMLRQAGLKGPALISRIAWNVTNVNTAGAHQNFRIRMKHVTDSVMTATAHDTAGLIVVLNPATYTPVLGINTHIFNTPFAWNGTDVILVDVTHDNGNNNYTQTPQIDISNRTYNGSRQSWSDAFTGTLVQNPTSGAFITGYTSVPVTYLTFTCLGSPSAFAGVLVDQTVTSATAPGQTNQQILRIRAFATGGTNINATAFNLSNAGTTLGSDVSSARLYGTGLSPVFSTANPLGAQFNNPSNNYTINTIAPLASTCGPLDNDTSYFWLTYNISPTATASNTVNATVNTITIADTARTPLVTPGPGRIISPPMSGSYTIGAAGNYSTITLAVGDLNSRGASSPITFQLIDPIYSTATGEVFPITIGSYRGMSTINTLTIRPAVGANPLIIGNNATSLFILDGAKYVRFDGSPSASPQTRELTIENQSNLTTATVIRCINDAVGTTIRSTIIRSANSNTNTTTQPVFGAVYIGGTNVGLATGNDSISIVNNYFARSGGLQYTKAIVSDGQSSIFQNNNNTIDSNDFNGFTQNAIFVTPINAGNGSNWRIRGNSFYDTAFTTSLNPIICIDFNPSTNSNSNNNIISGNFIGGNASQAPITAGSRWVITSSISFIGIRASGGPVTGNTITNNTIRSLRLMNIANTNSHVGISVLNPGVATVTNNTIGHLTDTNSVFANINGLFTSILSGTGNNVTIENNILSNINNAGNSTSTAVRGIVVQSGNNNVSNVNGNLIRAMSTRSTNTGSTTACAWNGIVMQSFSPNQFVNNNTIGGNDPSDSCAIYYGPVGTELPAGTAGGARMAGIILSGGTNVAENNIIKQLYSQSNGANTGNSSPNILGIGIITGNNNNFVRNNVLDSFLLRQTNIGYSINGIVMTSGSVNVSNNIIRNFSLRSSSASTGTGACINGINWSAFNPQIVANNTISNFDNALSANSSQINGIVFSSGAGSVVRGNTIRNLRSLTTSATGIVGINNQSFATNQTVSNNTIHSLVSYATGTSSPGVFGIIYSGSTTIVGNTNIAVNGNFIHSFNMDNTGTGLATMTGIQISGGNTNTTNNVIRLGRDTAGLALTRPVNLRGIHLNSIGQIQNRILHNTVYVETQPTTGSGQVVAIDISGNITAPGFTDIRNNIFANRAANAGGTGQHFAIRNNGANMLNHTIDNNIYDISTSATNFTGRLGITSFTTLSDWEAGVLRDGASGVATLNFSNATGDFQSVNMGLPSPNNAERGGDPSIASVLSVDFNGNLRDTLSPADIGAFSGRDSILSDVNAPIITYTPLINTSNPGLRTLSATIIDGGGLPLQGNKRPRIYFKKNAAGTWFDTTGVLTSGNRFNGSWTFNINPANLGGLTSGDSVYYFVGAEDSLGANFNSSPMFASATGVASITTYPAQPSAYRVLDPLPTSILVGTGQIYPTLTGPGGLFEAINNGIVGANTEALITSNITEPLNFSLNRWNEAGAGGYTVTIRPDVNAQRIISTSTANANGIIQLNNVNGFRMLGWSPIGAPGDTNLIIRSSSISTPAISFINGGINDTFVNVIFESRVSSTASGIFFVQPTTLLATSGVSNVLVQGCHFRQDQTSLTSSLPANGIYINGTSPRLNTNFRITGNFLYNCTNSAINVIGNSSGNNFTITSNHVYFNALPAGMTTGFNGISFTPGLTSENNNVSGNWIGGTAPFTGGTNLISSSQFVAMNISAGSGAGTLVNNNVVSNVRITGFSGMTGIFATGSAAVYTINGNRVGNFNDSATSIIFTAASNSRLQGIHSATSGNTTITNDTVVNIFNYGTSTTAAITGILISGGFSNVSNVNNNLIRNLILTSTTNTTTNTGAALIGIMMQSSSNNQFILNNNIRNLQVRSTSAHQTIGIITTAGVNSVNNNTLAGFFTASTLINNITSFNAFGAYNALTGIANTGWGAGIHNTNNNLIDSFVSTPGTPSGTQLIGIQNTYNSNTQQYMVQNNIVQNLYSSSNTINQGQDAALIGIVNYTQSPNQSTDNNIVRNLRLTANTAGSIIGIYYQGSNSFNGNVASVSRNLVHSLSSNAQAPNVPNIVGVMNNFGRSTFANNMIRLGIDSSGTADTSARATVGILQRNTNTTANNYYHNTILIGGEPQSGAANTAAIEIGGSITDISGFVNVIDIRNNILSNRANNGTNATGKNFAIKLASTSNINSNFNLFNVTGTGGFAGGTSADFALLGGTTGSWQASTGLDRASGSGNPNFVAAASGPYAGVILDVQGSTPIERSGDASVAVATDFYGNSRSGLTSSDIGAHAGNFNQIPDVFPPVITFTPLINSGTFSGVRTFSGVNITDNNGIHTAGANAPRVHYTKDLTNWFSTGPTSFTGSATNATFNFGIDYSVMGTLTVNDTIRYFVIAQDLAGNVVSNSPYAIATNVNTITTYPTNPNRYNFLPIIPANTVFLVGATSTYTSLTGAGGFFEFMNSRTMGGNVFAHITSDLLNETGAVSLNTLSQDGPGAGTFALTIRPDSGTTSTFLVEGNAANALININGANNVKISGVPANGLSTLRRLLIRNNNTTASTILLSNGAQGARLNNLIIEGGNTSAAAGVVSLLVTSGTTGTSQDSITGCIIRNNSTLALPAGIPNFGIYSNGSSVALNAGNVFASNEILNFANSGIAVANLNGNGYVITGNSMYNNLGVTLPTATQFVGINFFTNNNSSGNNISGNFIGGSAANCGGAAWSSTSFTTAFLGIRAAVGTGATTNVSNNTVANINFSSPGSSQFNAIISDNGNISITNNTVGSLTNNNSIIYANATSHFGITYQGQNNCVIDNNTIAGLVIGTSGLTANFSAIQATNGAVSSISGNTIGSTLTNSIQLLGTGTLQGINASVPLNFIPSYNVANNTIRNMHIPNTQSTMIVRGIQLANGSIPNCFNNTISNLTSNSTNISNTFSSGSVMGINVAVGSATIPVIRNNTIFGLRSLNTSSAVTPNVTGIMLSGGQGIIIDANRIYDLTNASTSTSLLPTPSVSAINITSGSINSFITNNQIALGTGSSLNTQLIGIWLNMSSTVYTLNAINNSVMITGTAIGNQNSYAFLRGNNSASELNTYLNIRNNIFANNRAGGTGVHFAIANQTPAPSNFSWTSNSSQYNLFVTTNSGTVGQWGLGSNNLSNWSTNSGSDAWSYYMQAGTGAGQLNLANLFPNAATGNLNTSTTASESWYVFGKGIAGAQVNNLNTDFAGNSRGTTAGFGISIGSTQLATTPTATPPAAVASGLPAANTTVSYTFAARPVATINWGASAPTSATMLNFTGITAANQPSGSNANQYLRLDVSGGTTPYNYGVVLNYDPALLGAVSSAANLRVSTSTTGSTISSPVWVTNPVSNVNQINNTVTTTGLSTSLANMFFTATESNAPPVVNRFVPSTVSVGDSIRIFGRNFTGTTTTQFFNGINQTAFTIVNDTTIATTVPSGATTGVVSATNSFGTGTSTALVTVIQPPTIASFNPSSGTIGTTITITGSNFSSATQVRVNGINASSFVIVSSTSITAVVASGTTTGTVTVTNPAGTATSATSFTVLPAPSITSFTPASGAVGTTVTITGNNFNAITAVRFNGITASYTVNSVTEISATVPAGATTGVITVVNGSGTGTSATNFTVLALPTITTISPSSGGVGTTVTINGTNLTGATAVSFNGTAASSFTVISSTQINAVVATGTTTGTVSVTTPAGSTSSSGNFTVISNLVVSTTTAVSGTYNNITVTSTGNAILSGTLTALGNTVVQSGGRMTFGTEILTGTGNFTAQNNSRLVIGSADGVSSSGIIGNIQVNGTRTIANGTVLEYNGSGNQQAGNLASAIDSLIVNTSTGDLLLSANLTVNTRIIFTSGRIRLGANNLTIGSAGVLTGVGSSSYVVTNGAGSLRRTVQNNATNILYPVGSITSYTPAQVQLNATSVTDIISVRVFDGVLANGTSGGNLTTSMVDRTWVVAEAVAGGSNATLSLTWNASDEVGSFNRNNSGVSFYRNTPASWMAPAAYVAATGSNPFTLIRSGLTLSTTPTAFAVGDNLANSTLPVQLTKLIANKAGEDVIVNWSTASEFNNSHFEVERSFNGADFELAGKVDGVGFTNSESNYNFVDEKAALNPTAQVIYYRLKQVDFDGKHTFYGPVAVNISKLVANVNVSVYPNPFTQQVNVQVVSPETGTMQISITDLQGRAIYTGAHEVNKGIQVLTVDGIDTLKDGVYFMNTSINGSVSRVKLVKTGN